MNNSPKKILNLSLLYLLLVVMAVGAVSIFKAHTFRALGNEAMNNAQIARNISDFGAFATNVIPVPDPLQPTAKTGKFQWELKQAPLYPVLLANAFGPGGKKDATVTLLSEGLYVLSVVLLFALAQRVLKQAALAFAVAATYLFSISVLSVATAGLSQSLGVVLVLAMLLTLTPANEPDEDIDGKPALVPAGGKPRFNLFKGNNFFLTGLLAGLCYLTDYCSLLYVIPLVVLWPSQNRKWDKTALFTFLLAFLLVCAPWWIRNVKLTGVPFYGSEWLLLSGRSQESATMLANWKLGLSGFFYTAVTVPHLLLAPFIVLSWWIRPTTEPLARRAMAVIIATVLALVGFSGFGRTAATDLVPLAGLLTIVGLVTFLQIVSNSWFANSISRKIAAPLRFESVPGNPAILVPTVTKAARLWRFHQIKLRVMGLLRVPITLRTVEGEERLFGGKWFLKSVFEARAVVVLVLLLLVPLALQIKFTPAVKTVNLEKAIHPIARQVPANRVIVTDIPQAVAWYTARKSMPLPERATQFLEIKNSPIGALYLADFSLGQNLEQWRPAYNRVNIPGYQLADVQSNNKTASEVLYLRQPSVQEIQRVVKARPKEAKGYFALGEALLSQRKFAQARDAFGHVQKSDPNSPEGYVGGGLACLNLRDFDGAKALFARGVQLAPRNTNALLGMAQVALAQRQSEVAIGYFEKVLADAPGNPYALNNLASIYSEQGNNLYRALEMGRRALAANPNNNSILDTVGWICYRLGYRKEAVAYLKRAHSLPPRNPTIDAHLRQALAGGAG